MRGVENINVECAGVSKTLTLSVRGCRTHRVCGGVENFNVECVGVSKTVTLSVWGCRKL